MAYREPVKQHFLDARTILESFSKRLKDDPAPLADHERADWIATCDAFSRAIAENIDRWAKSLQ